MRLTRMPFLGTVLCVAVVLAGQTNFAESEVGAMSSEVSGQVNDVCGRVIPGATVTFGNDSGTPFRVITDGDGRYMFRDIGSTRDPWVLGVEAVGFEKERRGEIESDLELQPDEPHVIKISLRPR
jgi:Carboxypeptidase regulatory-like domain